MPLTVLKCWRSKSSNYFKIDILFFPICFKQTENTYTASHTIIDRSSTTCIRRTQCFSVSKFDKLCWTEACSFGTAVAAGKMEIHILFRSISYVQRSRPISLSRIQYDYLSLAMTGSYIACLKIIVFSVCEWYLQTE
jgi:hypothetical protein